MTIKDEIIAEIQKGRAGNNQGLSMGLSKLESIIDGVCQETYTLIISNSGAGKTSYALYAYLYKPLMATINNDNFKVLYFSLEMNRMSLFVKLLSIYIFETFGIQLSFKKILSRERGYILDDDSYELVMKCMPWIESISEKVEIYDKNVNANTVYAILKDRLSQIGTFKETETRLSYTLNNPNLIYNVIVDHVGLLTPSQGHTLKQEIDLFSKYMVFFREKCKISPIVIQQANREQGNIERLKQGRSSFSINDAKDTGNTVNDSNIMIAVYNPFRDGLKTYKQYDIERLGSNFRSIQVLKNRFGDCDIEVGCAFYGWINYFSEIPRPECIDNYEKYRNPLWILESEDNTEIKEINNNNSSKFVL